MYSTLIKNGTVIDGTGKPGRVADVAIEDAKIVAIDQNIPEKAATIIDATGKIIAPGFIDIQNHSDSYWILFDNPEMQSLLGQGFTTICVGQCGASLAPILSQDGLLAIRKWREMAGTNVNWTTFTEYLDILSANLYGCNVASLTGYSTLRRGLIGDEVRPLETAEIEILKGQLQYSLDSGSFGLSTGLAYSHEINISELELSEIAEVVKKNEGLFSVHLRSEYSEILESLEEVIEIGKHTGVNLKVSHFKVRDQENWDKLPLALSKMEEAFHRGVNIHFDAYPYDSIWQVVYSYLPKWIKLGGRKGIVEKLSGEADVKKLFSELANHSAKLQSLIVASTGNQLGMVGKTIGQIAADTGLTSEQAFVELVKNAGTESLVFDRCMNEDHVMQTLEHPLAIVATDGAGFSENSGLVDFKHRLVHPRCFGTAPRFIKNVIARKKITLEEAIHKLTEMPANKLGIKKRGTLQVGNFADIVIFDAASITDKATLTNPFQLSAGIEYVYVNGKACLSESKLTGQKSGQVLRKK